MKVAIVSLRFAPGHMAHLRAYRELFKTLGCDIRMFLAPDYKDFMGADSEIDYTDEIKKIDSWKPDKVFSYNIANKNILLAKHCKKSNIPFFYVLHEPWDSVKELMALRGRMPRRVVANLVNYITCKNAYKVILASQSGKEKYEKYMHKCNKNYVVFPLIFCDDYDEHKTIERKFFSFIGGFTEGRGCREFLDFVRFSIQNKLDIKFLIASRSGVYRYITDETLKTAISRGFLKIYAGKPMSSAEINTHYRESVCAWNAYKSSTQSGVLPNSLMQGTPVMVSYRGDSTDIVTDKVQGCYITLPHQNEEILDAYHFIKQHIDQMQEAARLCFYKHYYYGKTVDLAKQVYEIE
jgi:hypothetical protein